MKTRFLPLFCCSVQILFAQSAWFSTGQSADLMVSGLGFNNTGGAQWYNHPSGIASDGTHFLICDRFNNRILVWNTLPGAWNAPPDLVLGQPDFTSNNPGTGKQQLNWAGNASLAANGKLAVADTENDRILLWNAFPAHSGQAADVSLYLPAYTPGGSTQQYGWPWGVWTDGSRLAAVATSGGALLFWNTFPTADNTPPDYSIRLPQFGTPRNISTDGSSYFFVGDHNAKVNGMPGTFFWNSYPSTADQPYDFYRNEWIKGEKLPSGQLVAGGLNSIYIWNSMPVSGSQNPDLTLKPVMYKNGDGVDVLFAGNRLYVNNYNGNNVLVFNGIPGASGQLPDFAVGSPGIAAQTLDSIRYIQNPVPVSDGTRLVVSSDFDRTINVWNTFPSQSGQKPDQRIALSPAVPVWASALHDNRLVLAARKTVSVWSDATQLSALPTHSFSDQIGTAGFTDLTGVALDGQFFYLADKSGKIYGWKSIPATATENPAFVISNSGLQYGFLHSDGQYLCAVKPEPPSAVYIYKVADLAVGSFAPYKTIISNGALQLNQASQAITFGQSLAVACRGGHSVLLWENISEAGDPSKAIVLGQPSATSHDAAIGADRLFMPTALLASGNSLWVGEFKFSSRILKFTPGTTALPATALPETGIRVFPNPAMEVFTLQLVPLFSEAYIVDLVDAGGQWLNRLFTGFLTQGEERRFAFSANQLPVGVSFLKITSVKSRGIAKVVRVR